jgi:hypothetical protein
MRFALLTRITNMINIIQVFDKRNLVVTKDLLDYWSGSMT